jgi:hypothetical protein
VLITRQEQGQYLPGGLLWLQRRKDDPH